MARLGGDSASRLILKADIRAIDIHEGMPQTGHFYSRVIRK